MRTTLSLDNDVTAAVQKLRNERDIGLSEAVNELIRSGLNTPSERKRFQQTSHPMGLRIDISNTAKALEQLESPTAR